MDSILFPDNVVTLSIDVGGSGIKGALLDARGEMISERVRIDTPYPCPPSRLVETLVEFSKNFAGFDRMSVGFPGLVRDGRIYLIPSLSRIELEGEYSPELAQMWHGHDLESHLATAFPVPVCLANDADVQGCAVIQGSGLEFVVTLGTGVGTALFWDGTLLPHFELGHAPFRKGESFEQQLGNAARKDVGKERWAGRVRKAIDTYDSFLHADHIYIGGGNARLLDDIELPTKVTVVSNAAGILGGIKIWDR
ncbi:MAG: ROK family protein [Actinomycetes bacterium]